MLIICTVVKLGSLFFSFVPDKVVFTTKYPYDDMMKRSDFCHEKRNTVVLPAKIVLFL